MIYFFSYKNYLCHFLTFFFLCFCIKVSYCQLVWWENKSNGGLIKENFIQTNNQLNENEALLNYNPIYKIHQVSQLDLSANDLNQCEIYTVFVPSHNPQEELIWKFNNGNDQVLFTDKRIADVESNRFINFTRADNTKPRLVKYHHDYNLFQTRSFSIKDNTQNVNLPVTSFEGHLAEIILFNKRLSQKTSDALESHLALKYSLSLEGKNYYNQLGHVIWEFDESYYSRIGGLGRSDFFHLNQKQSQTNFGEGFISFALGKVCKSNSKNLNDIDEGSYLIWADNDMPLIFDYYLNDVHELQRDWLINNVGFSTNNLYFEMSHRGIFNTLDNSKYLWMSVYSTEKDTSHFGIPDFYKLEKTNANYHVDSILIGEDKSNIKLYKAPALWAFLEAKDVSCLDGSGELIIKPVGGVFPIDIRVSNGVTTHEYTLFNREEHVEINAEIGEYNIYVSDSEGLKWSTLYYVNDSYFENFEVTQSILFSENNPILYKPNFELGQSTFEYWITPSGNVDYSKDILIDETGVYTMVFSHDGCFAEYKVESYKEFSLIQSMTVYPNPSVSGDVKVTANFDHPQPYNITVYDMLGDVVINHNYPMAQFVEEKLKLTNAGTYVVTLSTGDHSQSHKLIVLNP